MRETDPAHPWRQAAFLYERARSEASPPLAESLDGQEVERQLADWQQLMGGDDALLEERLKAPGLDRESFRRLLAHPEAGAPPAGPWRGILQELLDRRHEGEPLPPALHEAARSGGLPFSGFLLPFLRLGLARLRERLAATKAPAPEAGVEAALAMDLAMRLRTLANRVLILELNVARMLGLLPGDTPQERFQSFSTAWFQDPQRLAGLLEEYPVLARLMATAVGRWVEANGELLERLAADRLRLARRFLAGRDLGALVEVKPGLSDPHRGGRSVARLSFSSGLTLIYKPKALAIEHRFQRLLAWLNAEGLRFPHRALAVLEGDGYGWVEFAEARECDSREALQRFYWRQGSLLALLYLVSAADFHRENLIAAGEHPVLVDLEGLFHHREDFESSGTALERALMVLGQSVLSVGMLPISIYGRGDRAGMDVSGLGGEAGQLTPFALPKVEDELLDTMRMVRRQTRMEEAKNLPRLGGEAANAARFAGEIVQGFEETWRLLARRREALAPLLRDCAQAEVRHVMRPTQRYGNLLNESLHPDFLRGGLERDKALDVLWSEVANRPALRRVLPFEHADLLLGDIPMFTARPGERHLWSSDGTCLPDLFQADSLGTALERLDSLDEQECARQVVLIRQSLLLLEKDERPDGPAAQRPAPRMRARAASPEECLATATAIGEELAASALRGREDACWIGLALECPEPERWSLMPLPENLYDGLAGLALFLAYLGAETGRSDFEALARAALVPVREGWRQLSPEPQLPVGPFSGWTSAAYVLGHLGALWGEPALLDEALDGMSGLTPLIDADQGFDLISGAAGCALTLLGLHRQTGDERALAAARRCGEHLLANAVVGPDGSLGWTTLLGAPLAGLSHGAAGIAWALLELAAATGDRRYEEAAHRALRFERRHFVPERGNWRDLRMAYDAKARERQGFMVAWCHGAAGIALGRVRALPHLDQPEVRDEIAIGIRTVLRQERMGNHSLCHGELGNLEVLHLAGEALDEPRWRRATLERAAAVIRDGREGGFRCGLPQGNQTPGLMAGLAGIGLGLLRLAAPRRVPSVLALDAAPPALRAPHVDMKKAAGPVLATRGFSSRDVGTTGSR